MDLSRKSKSFMISDILTEPLNLSSTCSGKAEEVKSRAEKSNSSSVKFCGKTSEPDKSSIHIQTKNTDLTKCRPLSDPMMTGSVGPAGLLGTSRHNQLYSPTLMPNCFLPGPNPFQDLGRLKSGVLGDAIRQNHPDHKSLGCFCSLPFCGGPNLEHMQGIPGPEPMSGFDGEQPPVPIPIPLYVRTRFANASELLKAKRCRRSRTVFTELQLMGLEKKFETQKYLSTPDRVELADRLGLSQIQVKTWYQNRRMKWKKQVLQQGGTEPPTKPKGRPKKSFLAAAAASGANSGNVTQTLDSPRRSSPLPGRTSCEEGHSGSEQEDIYVEDNSDSDSDSIIQDI